MIEWIVWALVLIFKVWAVVASVSFVAILLWQVLVASIGRYSYFNQTLIYGTAREVVSAIVFLLTVCAFWPISFPAVIREIIQNGIKGNGGGD